MEMTGLCHLHSLYSYDGSLSLPELRHTMLSRGLRFALMTEHTDQLSAAAAAAFIAECRQETTGEFVFVPGFEVPYLGTHVLVIGAERYYENAPADELLAKWHTDGALLVLAHPHRNGYTTDTFLQRHLAGAEIWNSQYDGIRAPRSGAWRLQSRLEVNAYGSVDLHRKPHMNGPRLVLDIGELTEQAILSKLKAGEFVIRRGSVAVSARGRLLSGRSFTVRTFGVIMPLVVRLMQGLSSMTAVLGLRTFPGKKWMRERI